MDEKIERAVRRARRERELGKEPVCILCGYSKPYALIPVTRAVFEKHHVVGWQNDWGLTVTLCRNCHWEQTETIRDAGISMSGGRDFPETLRKILRLLAIFLRSLAITCDRLAEDF